MFLILNELFKLIIRGSIIYKYIILNSVRNDYASVQEIVYKLHVELRLSPYHVPRE